MGILHSLHSDSYAKLFHSYSLSLSLVRWRYLRCCDFDDFSPSFPIGRQLWCTSNVQLGPIFQILEPGRCWSAPSPLAFHLSLHQSFLHTVLPDDVAKEPHLPLRHTLPQHQNRPNLLQHPFIRFPLRPWHPEQSSITPHFESINKLLVTTCHRPWFTAVNGYGKSSGPKEPHFESQTHTSALPYRHHVLHCSPTHRQPPPDFLWDPR